MPIKTTAQINGMEIAKYYLHTALSSADKVMLIHRHKEITHGRMESLAGLRFTPARN
jgi:hypothetical protein